MLKRHSMRFAAALLVALASLVVSPNAAPAAAPSHHQQVPGFYRLKVGDLEVTQPAETWSAAWSVILPLLQCGAVKPILAKTFPLAELADALRYLIEGRPFGRVVLTI